MTKKMWYGYKLYSNSTMLGWNKNELVNYIRLLEENIRGLHETNDNQYNLLVEMSKLVKEEELKKLYNKMQERWLESLQESEVEE